LKIILFKKILINYLFIIIIKVWLKPFCCCCFYPSAKADGNWCCLDHAIDFSNYYFL